jgi:hypothetical protein
MMMHWDEVISNLHLGEKGKFKILKIRTLFYLFIYLFILEGCPKEVCP